MGFLSRPVLCFCSFERVSVVSHDPCRSPCCSYGLGVSFPLPSFPMLLLCCPKRLTSIYHAIILVVCLQFCVLTMRCLGFTRFIPTVPLDDFYGHLAIIAHVSFHLAISIPSFCILPLRPYVLFKSFSGYRFRPVVTNLVSQLQG